MVTQERCYQCRESHHSDGVNIFYSRELACVLAGDNGAKMSCWQCFKLFPPTNVSAPAAALRCIRRFC